MEKSHFYILIKQVEVKKMNKKIVAIMLATLMSATMFAGMATVTAEEDEYLKEVKDHVTPEQWVEIEELLNKEPESRAKADLIPKDFCQGSDEKLYAKARNIGDAWARPFVTSFRIYPDGLSESYENVGNDWVYLGLAAGTTSRWLSSNSVSYSGEYWCEVEVNSNEAVDESNHNNNIDRDEITFS